MTKARAPLSFPRAIGTAVGLIGLEVAARLCRRAKRSLRHWMDPDRGVTPSLAQAIALDRAFIAAGGGYAPILESYARQLDAALADGFGCRIALANDIAAASKETGEAIAFAIQALQPGATPGTIRRALSEVEEALPLMPRVLGHLASLLPGKRAAQLSTGE